MFDRAVSAVSGAYPAHLRGVRRMARYRADGVTPLGVSATAGVPSPARLRSRAFRPEAERAVEKAHLDRSASDSADLELRPRAGGDDHGDYETGQAGEAFQTARSWAGCPRYRTSAHADERKSIGSANAKY